MAKKKRTYNPNRVKARRTYTFSEIAEIYSVHIGTIHAWRRRGLRVIDEATKPYLVMGSEIRRFIRSERKKRKHPCKIDEIFCTKCKCPRKSLDGKLIGIITDQRLSKKSKFGLIKGICEVCNQPLQRFSSDKQLREFEKQGIILSVLEMQLDGSKSSTLNVKIDGRGNESRKYKK